jgi:Ca2+-binding EF-hand superfamily protein
MITNAMLHSLPVCIWSVVIGAMCLYFFSVAFVLGVARIVQQSAQVSFTSDEVLELRQYFGTLGATMTTLYMSISGGVDWEDVYFATLALPSAYSIGFITYPVFMMFQALNIFSGMVIERAFNVVRQDRDFWIQERMYERDLYKERVRGLFHEMDLDLSGTVSWDEFANSLNSPHMEAYLSFIELDTANIYEIFQLLDRDGDETIDIEEFLDGVHDLKGIANKVQVTLLKTYVEDMFVHMKELLTGETVPGQDVPSDSILSRSLAKMTNAPRVSISPLPPTGPAPMYKGFQRGLTWESDRAGRLSTGKSASSPQLETLMES